MPPTDCLRWTLGPPKVLLFGLLEVFGEPVKYDWGEADEPDCEVDAVLSIGIDTRPCKGFVKPRALAGLLYVHARLRWVHRAAYSAQYRHRHDWSVIRTARVHKVASDL
jgi:hypothetical protein